MAENRKMMDEGRRLQEKKTAKKRMAENRKELSEEGKEETKQKDNNRKTYIKWLANEKKLEEENAVKDMSRCDPHILNTSFYQRIKTNFEKKMQRVSLSHMQHLLEE